MITKMTKYSFVLLTGEKDGFLEQLQERDSVLIADQIRYGFDLQQVEEGGDFAFEGEITNYTSTTASVSSGDYALQNRLTITVRVNFQNAVDQTVSFNNKTFSSYADYDSSQLLIDVQDQLIEEIVEALVNDIYMAAAGNW